MSLMEKRILVVDDSAQWRISLGLILQRDPSFQVVGDARDSVEVIEKAATLRLDVALLDIGITYRVR